MSKFTIATRSPALGRLVAHARTPLFRNGYALILSAAATSGLGVVYWMVATRAFPAEVVGLNSAVISAMLFVSGVAQLSLLSVMTRYLPRAGRASGRLVGGAYALTLVVAALAGSIFVLGIKIWSPALAFLGSSPLLGLWFVLAAMSWCIFILQDSVLAGLKQAIWVPIENSAFAIGKIVLLLLFAQSAARYGIFASWTIPGAAVLMPVNYLIFRRLLPRHAQASGAHAEPLVPRQIAGYAASNYLGSMLSLAVNTLLPLLVVDRLGPRANAYFAQPWLIAGSLQLIAGNMAVSLTVEAATDRARLGSYTRRALAHSLRLLAPLVLAVVIEAPYLLRIFGREYADAGTDLLRLLAAGALPNLVNMLYLGVARVRNRIGAIIAIQGALCALALGLSYALLQSHGITGVGIAWATSQTLVAVCIALAHLRPNVDKVLGSFTRLSSQVAGRRSQVAIPSDMRPAACDLLLAFRQGMSKALLALQSVCGGLGTGTQPPHPIPHKRRATMQTTIPAITGALSGPLGLLSSLLLILLLTLKEFLRAATSPRVYEGARLLQAAIVPLLVVFGLTMTIRLTMVQPSPQTQPTALAPRAAGPDQPSIAAPAPTAWPIATATAAPATIAYTVRQGDLLYSLALRYNTSVDAIAALNPWINPKSLVIGDVLRIPAPPPPAPTAAIGPGELAYTLRAGDTLYDLALRYNTTVEAITALNPQLDPSRLAVGQVLHIPAPQPAQERTP